ncbi:MAG: ABC transporter substrate-binding protein, partial [Dehalococcoidia bacterium]
MRLTTKTAIIVIASVFLATFFGACTPTPQKPAPVEQSETAFPLNIIDQMGRQVTIAALPQRIVSLSPGN